MKIRKTYRICLCLAVVLFFAININAQVVVPADDTVDDVVVSVEEKKYGEKLDTLRQDYRSIVYDSVQAIANDKGFYYKSYLDSLLRALQPKAPKEPKLIDIKRKRSKPPAFSFLGTLFWIAAIGLFLYLVYRLFLSNSSFLTRSRKNIDTNITIATNENSNDPDALLNNAIRSGNYRLAIRYLYLQTLKRLAERKYIEINTNKTNYEYVNEVRKHGFGNEFASLTLKYEYVWYGEYPVDEKLFEQIEGGFKQFNKTYTRS